MKYDQTSHLLCYFTLDSSQAKSEQVGLSETAGTEDTREELFLVQWPS